jgi:putative aldouronate transport system permease protein
MNRKAIKGDLDSRIFNAFNVVVLLMVCTVVHSDSSLECHHLFAQLRQSACGGWIHLLVTGILAGELSELYSTISSIWQAFFISVSKTTIGVVTHVFFCAMVGYGLSKKYISGRKCIRCHGCYYNVLLWRHDSDVLC